MIPTISGLRCINRLLLSLSSKSFFRYNSTVSTSVTLKNEGLFSSRSSLPYTAWKIIGNCLFGSSSQFSIMFLWSKVTLFNQNTLIKYEILSQLVSLIIPPATLPASVSRSVCQSVSQFLNRRDGD